MTLSKKLVFLGVTSSLSMPLLAGNLDSAAPSDSNSRMYTIEDIYNRLDGTDAPIPTGSFNEPISGPTAGTGKTLTEVYNKADAVMDSTPSCPSCTPNSNANPVFSDNGDGTVTDNRTCLIWLQDASCAELAGTDGSGRANWETAKTAANSLATGTCGLTDNSNGGDWRLPTIEELHSLVHYGYYNPAMSNAAGTEKWNTGTPSDDAFSGVQSSDYWSYTAPAVWTAGAWVVHMTYGNADGSHRYNAWYVWPVRGRK
jgi:hypothetical protein